jgi:hypothetical protein
VGEASAEDKKMKDQKITTSNTESTNPFIPDETAKPKDFNVIT